MEFRTEDVADKPKMAEKHFRRYIKAAEFLKKLNYNKFKIEYSIIGKGFAKYQSEDAHVCRIIATKVLS